MFGAILTRPMQGGDLGAFFMDTAGYVNMCIHGSIGLLTAALETGLLAPRGVRGTYVLETPAGKVTLAARLRKGKVVEVTVQNVPSFVLSADAPLRLPRFGRIRMDIAYAGNWFALVSSRELGIELARTPLRSVLDIGRTILRAARQQIKVNRSPRLSPSRIDLVEIFDDVSPPHAERPIQISSFSETASSTDLHVEPARAPVWPRCTRAAS